MINQTDPISAAAIDRSAVMTSLWREHAPELIRFATVLVGPNDAGDVTTEAFLRCTRAFDRVQVDNPRSYLFRSVTNAAHDLARQRSRQQRRDSAAASLTSRTESVDDIDTTDAAVLAAVAALSVRQRSIVYLAYWEDMTERAIAEALDLHVGTVRRHLHRAHGHLRKVLR